MDRQLTDHTELLAQSDSFERYCAHQPNAISALDLLGSLARLTEQSLIPAPAPPVIAPVIVTAPLPPAPQPLPEAGTSHDEYRTALKDRSVVDALLEFHKNSLARRVPRAGMSQLFQPQSSPEVQATPKPTSRMSRQSGTRQPILRPNS